MTMSVLLLVFTVVLLAVGFPVGFALAGATLAAVGLGSDFPLVVVLKEMFVGIDSFALLAVPFFILAAELMSGGSLTEVLLRFASQFVGHLRGGLGHANVLSLTMFSGISGSALADAAGPGAMLVRMMERAGYDRGYAAALTASTAIIGPIIPPSIIMIIYALQDDTVTPLGLFMAGIIPGLVIAGAMMITNQVICLRRGYKSDIPRPNLREIDRQLGEGRSRTAAAGHHPRRHARRSVHADRGLGSGSRLRAAGRQVRVPDAAVEDGAGAAVPDGDPDLVGADHRRRQQCLRVGPDDRECPAGDLGVDRAARAGTDRPAAAGQRIPARVRDLHRAAARRDGARAHPRTRRARRRHRPDPLRDDRDLQPDARDDHAAGRRPALRDVCRDPRPSPATVARTGSLHAGAPRGADADHARAGVRPGCQRSAAWR